MLHGVDMEVTVELGRTRMTVRDLLALSPGAVLELDRAAGSPADLLVNGRLIARGEVVVVDEDFGLRDHRDRRRQRGGLTVLELTVRLVFSLAVVVGLLLLLARFGRAAVPAASAGAPGAASLHRQPLSRSASVAVVTVGGRVLVLGTTDHQVSCSTELDPDELGEPGADDESSAGAGDAPTRRAGPAVGPPAVARADPPTCPGRPASHARRRPPARPAAPYVPDGAALAGSVLSAPQTWRQALAAATAARRRDRRAGRAPSRSARSLGLVGAPGWPRRARCRAYADPGRARADPTGPARRTPAVPSTSAA